MRHLTTLLQLPARAVVRPGMLLKLVPVKVPGQPWRTEDWVVPHDARGGRASTSGYPMFAVPSEDKFASPGVVLRLDPYAAYAPGQQVQCVAAVDADVEVLLAGDEIVFEGSPLVSAGDGTLCHWQSCPGAAQVVAYASEDIA